MSKSWMYHYRSRKCVEVPKGTAPEDIWPQMNIFRLQERERNTRGGALVK